jgi:hypothetical protein
VSFFNVCPLLNPNVYFSDILYTGFSGGLYWGPGFWSKLPPWNLGSVPIFGARHLCFLFKSASTGSSKNNAFS